jgi:O-antigen/teichoic acid export membrane protein
MGGVLGGYFQMQSAIWRIEERHTYAVLLGFFPPFAAFVIAFITFFRFRTLESVFLSMVSAMSLIFIWLLIKGLVPTAIQLNLSSSTSVRKNIAPYVVVAILTWTVGYGSTYLVKSLLTLEAVAAFVFVYTISSALQIVATSLNQVWSPRFFSLAQQQTIIELEVHNHRFFLIQGFCLGFISALVLFLYHPILNFFGGNLLQYQNNLSGLAWLLAGYIASIPWWHSQNYYYLNKKSVSFMNGVMISTSVGLIFWLIAISIWSVEGVYYGFFTMMLLRSLILWFRAKQLWALRFQGMAMVMGWGLIAGTVWLIRL